ncbi:MAG: BspA family leucine-rich repeat surface protein, partial [Cyclobacteriaceae bacterium]
QTVEQWGDIAWSDMSFAFAGCTNLTVPATDEPDLSGVTSMVETFSLCSSLVGTTLNDWDVSGINHLIGTFSNATSFNGDISSWVVTSVSSAVNFLTGATSFNQDIGGWDVSNVTNMSSLLDGATSFDYSLGEWDISNATSMGQMLNNVAMSVANYDATLIGWSTLDGGAGETAIPTSITLHAANVQYGDAGESAWNTLVNTYSWNIDDGGKVNYALSFDGIDDRVEITQTTLATGLTYEAWINTSSTDATATYEGNSALTIIGDVNNDVGTTFGITNGVLEFSHYETSWQTVLGSITVNDGSWHHVAVTHDNVTGKVNLYVDGTLDQTGNITWNGGNEYHRFSRVGSSYNAGSIDGDFFDGQIDEVRIWNTVRSAYQLSSHMDRELYGQEPGLEVYYPMSLDGAALDDLAGTADGTIIGAVQVGTGTPLGSPIPLAYQATSVSESSMTINFDQIPVAQAILVHLDDDADMLSPFASGISVPSPGTATSHTISQDLSGYVGQKIYYQIFYDAGDGYSEGSDPVAFMVTPGNALDFDGTDDYVEVTSTTDLALNATSYTFESWVKWNSFNPDIDPIWSRNQGSGVVPKWLFAYYTNASGVVNQFTLHFNGANARWFTSNTQSLTIDTWYHVAFTVDSNNLTFYLDGVEIGSATIDVAVPDPSAEIRLAETEGFYSDIQLDEVRVWNTPRIQFDIQNNLYNTLTGNETDLVGYYRFDETTGSSLPDLSGNSNDGSWYGPTGANSSAAWTTSGALTPPSPIIYNATNVTTAGFTPNNTVPSGAIDILVDVSTDPGFGSTLVSDQSIGTSGGIDINVALTANTQYYYRVKADYGGSQSNYSAVSPFMVQPGNALDFNGVSDYVTISDSDDWTIGTNDFVFEFWFKPDVVVGSPTLVTQSVGSASSGSSFYIGLSYNGTGSFDFFTTSGTSWTNELHTGAGVIEIGSWYHAVVTRDEGSSAIYINGVDETSTGSVAPNIANGTRPIEFSVQNGVQFFDGQIDEFRFYNGTGYSAQDVLDSRFVVISGAEQDIIAYYRFDELTGTTLSDLSGNGLDGALTNMNGDEWVASGAMLQPPAPPSELISYASSTTDITLEWTDDATDNTGYLIEWSTGYDNFDANIVSSQSESDVESATVNVGTDQGYYFRVTSTNGSEDLSSQSSIRFATTTPFPGTAVVLDGTDDYIDLYGVAADFYSEATSTIEFWFKASSSQVDPGAVALFFMNNFSEEDAFGLMIGTGGTQDGLIHIIDQGTDDATGTTQVLDDQWHHIAYTFDGSTGLLYLDGVVEASHTLDYTFAGDDDWSLGQEYDQTYPIASDFFTGSFDEFKVWVDLVKTDFSDRFAAVPNGTYPLVYYQMDENSGSTLFDRGGLVDGSIVGGAFYETSTLNVPAAPDNLIAYASSSTEITLEWTDNAPNETGFMVEASTDYDFTSPIDITGAVTQPNPGIDITSVTYNAGTDQPYFYRVTAINGSEDASSVSAVDFATTGAFPGSALSSDGNDYLEVDSEDNSLDLNTNATFEFWVNRNDGTGTDSQSIIDKTETGDDANYRVFINDESTSGVENRVGFWNGTAFVNSGITVNNGEWKHIAIVISGSSLDFYENGVFIENATLSLGTANDGKLVIGSDRSNITARALNGQVDEVRIWNVARTPTEIQNNIYNSLQGNEPNLVAYYSFDEASGIKVVDQSANDNSGTSSGATFVSSGFMVPAAPDSLIAYAISSSSVTLEWKDNADNETGFLIERADDFEFTTNVQEVTTRAADTETLTFSAGANQPYFYRVTATNGSEDASSVSAVEFATTEAFPGYALSFNGTTDYITMGNATDLQITGAFTYEFWIKTTSTSGGFVVGRRSSNMAAGIASNIEMYADGRLQLVLNDGATTSNATVSVSSVNDGEWHHVAAVYQPSNYARLYIDGVQDVNNASVYAALNGASLPFNIAYSSPASANFFNGSLDEIKVWDVAKTDFSDRHSPLSGDESNLIAYYPLDENVGTTAVDRSKNINDGDLIGSPVYVPSGAGSPNVIAVTSSVSTLSDAQTGSGLFSITVTYDQTMNSSVSPTLTFAPDISSVLTSVNSDGWSLTSSTDDTYTVDYVVEDVDLEIAGVDITVDLGQNLTGIDQASSTTNDVFDIDQIAPTLSSVSIGMDPTGNPNYASISDVIDIAITSSEDITNVTAAIFSGGIPVTNSGPVISGGPTDWNIRYAPTGTDTDGAFTFTIDFEDLNGNAGVQVTEADVTDASFVILDQTAPIISATGISADNLTLTIDFDDDIFSDQDGLTDVSLSNFSLNQSGGTATVTAASINVNSGTQIEIGLNLSGVPDGYESITVEPNASIYNAAGIEMVGGQSNNSVVLNDLKAPVLSGLTITDFSDSSADIDISVDEASTLYYVLTESSITPSASNILAGLDDLGSPASSSNNYSVAASSHNYSISSLDPLTNYFIYWIAEDGVGNLSSIVSNDFTTDAPPPSVVFQTITVPSSTLVAGTNDNLIYQVRMDVSGGSVILNGLTFTPNQTFLESDFVQFNYLESRGSDSFITSSPIGSNGFFNGTPGIPDGNIGLDLTSAPPSYTEETVYFYITADVASGAIESNTFGIALPDGVNNFFFDGSSIIDGSGLAASNVFTIQAAAPSIALGTVTDPSTCAGADGSIELSFTNVDDGTYALDYVDDALNPQTFSSVSIAGGNATILGLSAGTYHDISITVNSQTSIEDVDVVLSDPTLPIISTGSVVVTDESSPGATDGFIDATGAVSGGSGSYQYDWFSDAGLTTPVGSGITLTSLTAGTYYLQISDLSTGCVGSAESFIVNTIGTPTPFITTWSTTDGTITIPTSTSSYGNYGSYNYDITWTNLSNAGVGDGSDTGIADDYTITGLSNNDIYQIDITGEFSSIFLNNGTEKDKILSIEQWGDLQWYTFRNAFQGCSNLVYNATDAPDLTNTTSLGYMFDRAILVDGDLSNWDVSTIISLSATFNGATSFNGNIVDWDVSNVTNMAVTFDGATGFNQDISGWNTSNVSTLNGTFRDATSFNQNLNSWDVSSVTNFQYTFNGASSFNQPLSSWNLASALNLDGMFRDAVSFDQDISSWTFPVATTMSGMLRNTPFNQDITLWDVSGIQDFSFMFWDADNFNQPLDGWDVSSATTLYGMFGYNDAFNQDLNSWVTSSVTTLRFVFVSATSFNGNISDWDISSVTTLQDAFSGATSFNQDISTWNTSNVEIMQGAFYNATSFNQDLQTWDVSNATNLANMFNLSGLSTSNYDNILIGWAGLPSLQSGVNFGASGIKYTAASQASRDVLTSAPNNWVISDGGIDSPPSVTLSSSAVDPVGAGEFILDIIFSEVVTGLTLGEITVGNGVASNLVDIDGSNYTVEITPSFEGLVTVDLGAGSAVDAVGNGNTIAAQFSINVDLTAPTVSLSSTDPDPTNSGLIIVDVTFSEAVTGLLDTDFVVDNGT